MYRNIFVAAPQLRELILGLHVYGNRGWRGVRNFGEFYSPLLADSFPALMFVLQEGAQSDPPPKWH